MNFGYEQERPPGHELLRRSIFFLSHLFSHFLCCSSICGRNMAVGPQIAWVLEIFFIFAPLISLRVEHIRWLWVNPRKMLITPRNSALVHIYNFTPFLIPFHTLFAQTWCSSIVQMRPISWNDHPTFLPLIH